MKGLEVKSKSVGLNFDEVRDILGEFALSSMEMNQLYGGAAVEERNKNQCDKCNKCEVCDNCDVCHNCKICFCTPASIDNISVASLSIASMVAVPFLQLG